MSVLDRSAVEGGSAVRGYAKGRARRESIVQVATLQFAERGFEGATILEIAAACNISRAGLLHHFADKEALLEAVLRSRDEEDRKRFIAYVLAAGSLGVLRGMADLAEHNRLTPGLIELFVRLSAEAAAPSHPAHTYFVERYERIRSDTRRAIGNAAKAGYIRLDVDPSGAALELTALMDGLQSQWLFDRRINMSEQVNRTIQEWLTPEGLVRFAEIPAQLPTRF